MHALNKAGGVHQARQLLQAVQLDAAWQEERSCLRDRLARMQQVRCSWAAGQAMGLVSTAHLHVHALLLLVSQAAFTAAATGQHATNCSLAAS